MSMVPVFTAPLTRSEKYFWVDQVGKSVGGHVADRLSQTGSSIESIKRSVELGSEGISDLLAVQEHALAELQHMGSHASLQSELLHELVLEAATTSLTLRDIETGLNSFRILVEEGFADLLSTLDRLIEVEVQAGLRITELFCIASSLTGDLDRL